MIMKQQTDGVGDGVGDDDDDDDDGDDDDDDDDDEEECVCLIHFYQPICTAHGCVVFVENTAVLTTL